MNTASTGQPWSRRTWKFIAFTALAVAAITGWWHSRVTDFETCLLHNMSDAASNEAARSIQYACNEMYERRDTISDQKSQIPSGSAQ